MSDTVEQIMRAVAHRPWPLPDSPWIMFQSWRDQLFAHWQLAPEKIRSLVPSELALDTHEGRAWIGLTPFHISGLRARGLPAFPFGSEFPELNLRTYVTVNRQPGVYFFSLDAGSQLAVFGARLGYGLPYHNAEMSVTRSADGWTHYRSARATAEAELDMRYRATAAEPFTAEPGTLDHFLTERYVLYVVRGGRVVRGDIHHLPWQLHSAEATIERNTIALAAGIRLPDDAPTLHYSARQDALIWAPATVS